MLTQRLESKRKRVEDLRRARAALASDRAALGASPPASPTRWQPDNGEAGVDANESAFGEAAAMAASTPSHGGFQRQRSGAVGLTVEDADELADKVTALASSPSRPGRRAMSLSSAVGSDFAEAISARRSSMLQLQLDKLQASLDSSEERNTALRLRCDEYERALSMSRAQEAEATSEIRTLKAEVADRERREKLLRQAADMAVAEAVRTSRVTSPHPDDGSVNKVKDAAATTTTAATAAAAAQAAIGDAAVKAELERCRQQLGTVARDLDSASEQLNAMQRLFLAAAVGAEAAMTVTGKLDLASFEQLAHQLEEERELRNTEVAELEGMLAEALADLEDVKLTASKSRTSDHFMDDTLADFQDENIHLHGEVRSLEHNLDVSARERVALQADNQLLQTRVGELEQAAEKVRTQLEDARTDADQLRTQAIERQHELNDAHEQRSSLLEQVDALSEKLHAVLVEKQQLDNDYLRVCTEAQLRDASLRENIATLNATMRADAERLAEELRVAEDEKEATIMSTKHHHQDVAELELELKVAYAQAEKVQQELFEAIGLLKDLEGKPKDEPAPKSEGSPSLAPSLAQETEKGNQSLADMIEGLKAERDAAQAKLAEREALLTQVMDYLKTNPAGGPLGGQAGEEVFGNGEGEEGSGHGDTDTDLASLEYASRMKQLLEQQRGLERAYRQLDEAFAEKELELTKLKQSRDALQKQLRTFTHGGDGDTGGAGESDDGTSDSHSRNKAGGIGDGTGPDLVWDDPNDPNAAGAGGLSLADELSSGLPSGDSLGDDSGAATLAAGLKLQLAQVQRALTDQCDETLRYKEEAAKAERWKKGLQDAKDALDALRQENEALTERCSLLDSELSDVRAALEDTRGKLDSAAHAGLSLTDLIRNLQTENQQLRQELDSLRALLGDMADVVPSDGSEDETLADRLRRALADYRALQQTLADFDADTADLLKKLAAATAERDQLLSTLDKLKDELRKAQEELDALHSLKQVPLELTPVRNNRLQKSADDDFGEDKPKKEWSPDDLLAWIEEAKQHIQELEQQLGSAVSQLATSKHTIAALKQRINDLLDELNEKHRQKARMEVEVDAERRQTEWLRDEQEKTRSTVERLFRIGELNKTTIAKQEATIARLRADAERKPSTVQVVSSDAQEKIEALQQQLLQTLAELDALRTELDHQKQLTKERFLRNWQPDTNRCSVCSIGYSLFVRPHHCRLCGVSACADCCSHRLPTTASRRPARVCERCFDFVNSMAFDSEQISPSSEAKQDREVEFERGPEDLTAPFGMDIRFTTNEQGTRAVLAGFTATGLVVKKLVPLIVGDELVSINGTLVCTMSQAEVVEQLKAQSIKLVVRSSVPHTKLTATLSHHSLAQLDPGDDEDESDSSAHEESGELSTA